MRLLLFLAEFVGLIGLTAAAVRVAPRYLHRHSQQKAIAKARWEPHVIPLGDDRVEVVVSRLGHEKSIKIETLRTDVDDFLEQEAEALFKAEKLAEDLNANED